MAKAVRQADHAGGDRVIGLKIDFHRGYLRAQTHPRAVLQSEPGNVIRMHPQRVARLAFDQPLRIVHPGVIAAHMTPADQAQRVVAVAGALICSVGQVGQGAHEQVWGTFNLAAFGLQSAQQRGL